MRTFPASVVSSRTGAFYRRNALQLQYLFALLAAPLLTSAGLALGLDRSTANLLCLFLTVLFAARLGMGQASTLAVSAMVSLTGCYTPPLSLRHLATADNGFALVLFELTALAVSRVSARARSHAAESEIQRRRTQRLHAVSHNVLLLNTHDSAERQIAEFIQQEFELDAVAIVTGLPNTVPGSAPGFAPSAGSGSVGAAGRWAQAEFAGEDHLRRLATSRLQADDVSKRPLLGSGGPLGVLLILGEVPPLVLDSLASLASLALERHRACLNQSAADAARITEQLRTTVLDSLAHNIKTPLTIIRAASSGLLAAGLLDEGQQQLAELIDEHSEQLNEMTNRLLETARMEGEEMRLQLETIDLPALLREVAGEVASEAAGEFPTEASAASGSFTAEPAHPTLAATPAIDIRIAGDPHPVVADYEMIASTLRELLNNALKYSTLGSPITLSLSANSAEATLSVRSHGQVICAEDRERIFERFYRGRNHRHLAPGTGIGLSVARRVAEAHGGHIWVTSSEEEGTTFFLSLPIQPEPITSIGGL